MRVAFHFDEGKRLEETIFERMSAAALSLGDIVTRRFDKVVPDDAEVGVVFGVAGPSRDLIKTYENTGRRVIYVDKGYLSRIRCWRVSPGGFHPWEIVAKATYDSSRLSMFGVHVDPDRIREGGEAVMIAGTSAKFCRFAELGDPTEAHLQIALRLQDLGIQCSYRPKPSWHDYKPLPGFSTDLLPLDKSFDVHKAIVTFSSNVAVDAMLRGMPAVMLNMGAVRDVCPNEITHETLTYPLPRHQRYQIVQNLS